MATGRGPDLREPDDEMTLWAGIDEAGYGPRLGPLVVAGSAFLMPGTPREGILWELLKDAVTREARGSDGRLVINDSKQVYSPAQGLRRLEEGVLACMAVCSGRPVRTAQELMALLQGGRPPRQEAADPWFAAAPGLALPLASNLSAVASKAQSLARACRGAGVRMLAARAAIVFPTEYNRIVAATHNKSLLLFQKCGLLLQELWQNAGPGESHMVVDKHGGRMRYRDLLRDAFPDCSCDILREEAACSSYRICEPGRALTLSFREGGDCVALPAALGSMIAKYVREVHMHAFNAYWCERVEGLKPTAGYGTDAGRFLRDIRSALKAERVDERTLVRMS
jgi:ribonuclease HII